MWNVSNISQNYVVGDLKKLMGCKVVCYDSIESFRCENQKEDGYGFYPREVWYFVFVLVSMLT